jgi:Predicted membrane protein (DUF2254)
VTASTLARENASMDFGKVFLRSALGLSLLAAAFFGLEFLLEWDRLGRPGLADLSWAGANNAKLVDVLSPMARAYNNILAILLATIGLAIPLTANLHTPKLIDLFLRDRVNQAMLTFCALGAAHVLWTNYLIGPRFAPLWAYRLSVLGAVLGWVVLVPYFYYVMRFLDPSNILARLRGQITGVLARVEAGRVAPEEAHDLIRERLHHLGTIVLKAIDRADRGVVLEGLWGFKRLLDDYGERKPRLPAGWFQVARKDFVGMSADAIDLVNADRTWFEHRVLTQVFLAYQAALAKTQDVISSLTDAARIIATHAARRGDEPALTLAVRFFNNFLREAIKRKELHAVYDLLYQYRLLAAELCGHPRLLQDVGRRIRGYSELAAASGLAFVPQIAGFDLGWIVCRAYEAHSPAAGALLDEVLALSHRAGGEALPPLVKAKVILGGFFLEHGLAGEAARVRANLADVPESVLAGAGQDLLTLDERCFWEVTDRQVNFEWVDPGRRGYVKTFLDSLRPAAA